MAIKAIIFDIDGVLADSRAAVVHNTKQVLNEYGFVVKDGEVENMSSAHSAQSVFVGLVPKLGMDARLMEKILKRLSELTAENIDMVKPTPIAQKIPELSAKYKLAVASNRKASVIMVLEKFKVTGHFETVMSSRDAPPKPSPKMLNLALGKMGILPSEAVFVGDNEEDRQAARAANVRFFLAKGTDATSCERFFQEFLY